MASSRGWAYGLTSVLLVGLLWSAFPANAGTADKPEIRDAQDDQVVTNGGTNTPAAPCNPGGQGEPPAVNGCFQNADLLAGWVDGEDSVSFKLHVKVAGTAAASTLGSAYTWNFHFTIGTTAYTATAHLDGTTSGGAAGPFTGGLTFSGAAKSGTAVNGIVTFNVLKADVGNPASGASITQMYADARGYLASQSATYEVTDRAPDGTAVGTPYVMGGAGGTIKVVRTNVTTSPLTITHGFGNATSSTYVYNWTAAPANATLDLRVKGSGNATVLVRDAANATLLKQSGANVTRSMNLTGKAGRWTVQVNYTAFKGNLTLSIKPRTAAGNATGGPGASGAGGGTGGSGKNGTSGTSSSSKTPAPSAPAVLATLAAAGILLQRRRRGRSPRESPGRRA